MQSNNVAHAGDGRLRFVFDDAVVTIWLPANATLEDVARTWSDLTPEYHGNPIAIDVTMAVLGPPLGLLHTALKT